MNTPDRILVTGGYGCIGTQTVRWLLKNTSAVVVVGSRDVNEDRTQRLFPEADSERLICLKVDIQNRKSLEEILTTHEITHVIHLAALQTPDCNAHRDLGLQINLAGTQNLIEAVKACRPGLQRFVNASSVAVYGPRNSYSQPQVPMLADPAPVNVYGVWKLAGEHLARLFQIETGIPTLSLRPGVLFGPGRDAGLTAAPTTAMKSLVCDRPYEIPFRNRQDYLYAPDVGAAFGNAAMSPFTGYAVFTLPSHTVDTQQFVATMRDVAEQLSLPQKFAVTIGSNEVPFICDLDYAPFLQTFPNCPHTPLVEAVKQSLLEFQKQSDCGWL